MQDTWKALLIACVVCLITGPILIPLLRRVKFGQYVRDDGPKRHMKKAGTPTMGGVMFFFSLSIGTLVVIGVTSRGIILLAAALAFGLIGFFDDYIKVVLKRSLGLRAKEKLIGQFLISGIFAYIAVTYLGRGTAVVIPGSNISLEIGWLYIPFAIFILMGVNNAVNLTDGLDGLAAGVTVFAALAFLFIASSLNMSDVSVFSAALIGTCIGFLFFNIYPARIFMGDTGSLALGGAIGVLAIITKTELLLPILGCVYLLETLSVIIQVIYFKITKGKRFFKMAPLHHHFELSGWSEKRVVLSFWTFAAVCASISVYIMM